MNTRKTLALLASAAVLTSAASCGSKTTKTEKPQTADMVIGKAYKALEVSELPVDSPDRIYALGDSGGIMLTGYSDGKNHIFITDEELSEFNEVPVELGENDHVEASFYARALNDGTILVHASVTDFGDNERPNWDDPDFDYDSFDFETLYASATSTQNLMILDREGNVLSDNEVKGLDKLKTNDDDQVYLGDIFNLGDQLIARIGTNNSESYYTMSTDGTIGTEVDLGRDDVYLYESGCDAEGNLIFIDWDEGGTVICTIDCKTMKLRDEKIKLKDLDIDSNTNVITAGIGQYSYFISGTSSLYGITGEGKAEEVINWTDSDLNGNSISSLVPLKNGDFIVLERNHNGGKSQIYRMTERDVSELANTQVITIAVDYADDDFVEFVKTFNQSRDDVRIRVEDYNKYYEWDEETQKQHNSPENQMKLDIAAGKKFDIIRLYSTQSLYHILANKGMFADMYPLLDADSEFSREDFLPNVLEGCENDGKLLRISPTFIVNTLAVKTKFYDKPTWTIDEMMDTYKANSDKFTDFYMGATKYDTLMLFFRNSGNKFIDMKNGTCNFDSPEFLKILEFCNELDTPVEFPDYSSMTSEEIDEYQNERYSRCRNDKAMTNLLSFYGGSAYNESKIGEFGEDITLAGMPGAPGNGAVLSLQQSYSICESSPNKEACWDFIKQFMSAKAYEGQMYGGYPSVKKYFTKKLDEGMEDPYWVDETGKKQHYENNFQMPGMDEPVKIPPLTQEERDMLEEYMLGAVYNDNAYDTQIEQILSEDTGAFFAGEKTAEETAKIIQNRLSILVSEQS